MTLSLVRSFVFAVSVLMLSSCAEMGSAVMLGATDALTDGKILPVKDNPKSLGRKRLEAYAVVVPRLKSMLAEKGYPDRVIETISFGGSRKVVMYYTKEGVAYLIVGEQFSMPESRIVGPSPIGAKTKELFAAMDNLQKVAGEISAEKGKEKPAVKR